MSAPHHGDTPQAQRRRPGRSYQGRHDIGCLQGWRQEEHGRIEEVASEEVSGKEVPCKESHVEKASCLQVDSKESRQNSGRGISEYLEGAITDIAGY